MKLKCIMCDNVINTKEHKGECYFQSRTYKNDVICQDCADESITYVRDIDAYVFGNIDKETFTDDEISDLDIFVIKDVDDLELYDEEKDQMDNGEEKQLKELVTKIAKDYGLEDDYYNLFVTDGKQMLPLNFIMIELYRSLKVRDKEYEEKNN